MLNRRIAFLSVAGAALFAVSARAGTVMADFTDPENIDNVNFDSSFGVTSGASAAIVDATRTDTPGPGVDTLLPQNFRVFCVELGQDIFVPQVSMFSDVVPLSSDPTTNPGNITGPVTFDATRAANVEKLFGSFYPGPTDTAANDSFQLALWELAFDDDLSLIKDPSDPNDRVWVDDITDPIAATAQGYLDAIKADEGVNALPEANLVLLTDPTVQDQLALVPTGMNNVPEPTTLGLIIPAGLLMLPRRRASRV